MKCCRFKAYGGAHSAPAGFDRGKTMWIPTRLRSTWCGCHALREKKQRERIHMCVYLADADFDLPGARRVLVDLGILWIPRLPFGQTYPAVLLVQARRHCPVEKVKVHTIQTSLFWSPLAAALANSSAPTLISMCPPQWDFFALLILFKVVDFIKAHRAACGSMPIFKLRLTMDSSLIASSEWLFYSRIVYPSVLCTNTLLLKVRRGQELSSSWILDAPIVCICGLTQNDTFALIDFWPFTV